MFRTLLIANRGEIACRIARTARRMGITTVAVFSDADCQRAACQDRGSCRFRSARLRRGTATSASRASSLRHGMPAPRQYIPATASCPRTPHSPRRAPQAGLIFVGPPAAAMRAMGSKSAAKALMERSGVPLLPGYHGDDQDAALSRRQAMRVGFPVMIKAVAGGGGRGMRVVGCGRRFRAALGLAHGRRPPRPSATTAF